MSDRTPEQVVADALREWWQSNDPDVGLRLPKIIDALRAEGMLVEEGEVKVRLDGLEERIAEALLPEAWPASRLAAIAARVVRGETQEADRG